MSRQKVKLYVLLALVLLLLGIAAFAPYLVPFDPYEQNLSQALQAPGGSHLLGTDRYGRDMLSRVIMGSQTTIYSALLLVAVITVTGTSVGLFCGWRGGKLDSLIMRISDIFLAFPGMVFAIAVAGVLGGGILNAVIALACISWPKFARLARSQVLMIKDAPFLAAARLSGSGGTKIVFRHILPNILGPVLVTATLDIGTMMMEIAGLSFLGLGAMPPIAEWGSMMSSGRSMLQTSPWVILAPGCAIFVTVMLFNLLGDTVRDVMDPRQSVQHVERR
ncbi:ABC transporter permease subunit [Lactonifactor sp. BIOML-A3]|uniref:nickel transporter permease n=1 Tax=unclassified Lactonifactor TaxID=2636670 RepID=UPI0012B133B7|nr:MULTISPECIES: nickel transporter permease [unclassified Lactonifactor]MSA01857.1 ABC transporter permease subunit [Lactonifactor sp. BIOML-A5]MSA08371.1 ABC transporter permease subunit [Lactonifactor sp. BIOML-A4]MSA12793.1 ABC transporter permease subunit [Lactonifactor sp. BIOML-A3]MSA17725.1 ABC transporter permease subunit [Lactonifactor sp. BIOML-A2]MSA38467.1 ABC transporter permease subunit [Lactonifactor sp. BIOML-A1]